MIDGDSGVKTLWRDLSCSAAPRGAAMCRVLSFRVLWRGIELCAVTGAAEEWERTTMTSASSGPSLSFSISHRIILWWWLVVVVVKGGGGALRLCWCWCWCYCYCYWQGGACVDRGCSH